MDPDIAFNKANGLVCLFSNVINMVLLRSSKTVPPMYFAEDTLSRAQP